MSKKKKAIIALIILAIVLIAFICGQVFAKYFSKVRGNGMAEVATWNFKVNGDKEEVRNINLASTCNNRTLVNNKIAPGTSGSFDIIIDASGSDVGIDYKVNFTEESNKPQNLKFIYDGIEYDNITDLTDKVSGNIVANDEYKIRTITIQWKWEYETGEIDSVVAENDAIDTQNAEAFANYNFQVVVSGTQVKPQ